MTRNELTKLWTKITSLFARKTDLNNKQDVINDLNDIRNGAALGTTALLSYIETDPTVPSWAKLSSKPSYTYSEISGTPTLANVATSGSYNDLIGTPDIPDEIKVGPVKGRMHRTNVSGSGNITITSASGIGFPNAPVTGNTFTYDVAIYVRSTTPGTAYSLTVNFGNTSYTLAAVNGVISDVRSITTDDDSLWTGSISSGSVGANSEIIVVIYQNVGPAVKTVGPAAITNNYADLNGLPTIPSAPGTLNTNNTTAQTASSSEALSGTIKLHKVSKTGSYNDLIDKPTIPTVPTNVSAFTNDAGYLTSHQDISGKQDALTVGNGIAIDNSDTIRSIGIPFGIVDGTSTKTAFTATVPGINRLEDGVCVLLKNGVVTSASGFTININGLGAKPCYSNMAAATAETTLFNINYTILFVYDSTRVTGGCWIYYRGYYTSSSNSIGYLLRGNNASMYVSDTARYYKIYFTSADGTKWVPASVNSTNDATSARIVNQRPIDPFGRIVYTSANTKYTAGTNLAASTAWTQYPFSLGYSFNRTGKALELTFPAPVYIKCAPQSDGSAIIDANVPYVQSLPSTNDGKIYIYLGLAYSATNIEMHDNHPVYYHDGTGIRLWTGKDGYTKGEVDNALSGKQDALVSGTNIKTINNESLLGSGNISIQGGSGSANIEYNSSKTALVIGGGSTKYTISLDDPDMSYPSVKINDFTYSESRFPLEVNSGDILNVVISVAGMSTCTTTMGGTTVSTSKSFSIQSVSGNIVITVAAPSSEPEPII